MNSLEIRLSASVYERLRVLVDREGIDIKTFIITAITEKLSALDTETLRLERGKRGSSAAFLSVLAKAPSDPPLRGDELP
jgi:hypothetical protein